MSITSKIRIARGLKANLPAPPSSFEIGRPYYCTDTHEMFIGAGLTAAMTPVGASVDLSAYATLTDLTAAELATLTTAKAYTDSSIAAIPAASPGGTAGQLQYNNAGGFGGAPFVYGSNQLTATVGTIPLALGDLFPTSPGLEGGLAVGNPFSGAGVLVSVGSEGPSVSLADGTGNYAQMSLVDPITFAAGNPNFAIIPANGNAINTYLEQGLLVLGGVTSGFASVQVAAVAGTPNPLQLPLVTGTAGQILETDGNNPQQLSWITPVVYDPLGSAATETTRAEAAEAAITASIPALPITEANVTNLVADLAGKASVASVAAAIVSAEGFATASDTSAAIAEVTRANAAYDASGAAASAVATEVTNRNTAIAVETTARIAADASEVTARNTAIGVETTRATTAEGLLATSSALSTETTNRIAADATTLASAKTYADADIATEVTNRNSAITTAVGTETSRATTAEALLATSSSLSTEVTNRTTADTTLQTNITAEATTRATADTTNATAISTETTRATTAEGVLAPLASPTFTGTVLLPTLTQIGATDTGISRTAPGVIAVGNGTSGDVTGTLKAASVISGNYFGSATTSVVKFYSGAVYDTGISRLSGGVVAIGNGAAADYSGSLKIGAVSQMNGTVATVLTTNASPLLTLSANYWATGAVSSPDSWTIGSSVAAGLNGASNLTLAHSGSTGLASVVLPVGAALNVNNLGTGHQAAGVIIIANDTSGQLNPGIISTGNGTSLATYGNGGVSNVGSIYSRCVASQYLAVGAGGVATTNWSNTGTNVQGINMNGTAIGFSSALGTANDTGISRIAAATLAVGNGVGADQSGTLSANAVSFYQSTAANVLTLDQSAAGGILTLHSPATTGVYPGFRIYPQGVTTNGSFGIITSANNIQFYAYNAVAQYCGGQSAAGALNPFVGIGSYNAIYATNTTGTQVGVSIGTAALATTANLVFIPGSASSSSFIATQIIPIISATANGANSGGYTALKIAPQETSLGSGTNRLIDCYAGTTGTTGEFYVTNTGAAWANSGFALSTSGAATQGMSASGSTTQIRGASVTLATSAGVGVVFTGTVVSGLTQLLFTASSGAPTSAGTAGTAGQIIYFGGLAYLCSVTGAAGSATWNKLSMVAV